MPRESASKSQATSSLVPYAGDSDSGDENGSATVTAAGVRKGSVVQSANFGSKAKRRNVREMITKVEDGKQVAALPSGFFDNVDDDARAHGEKDSAQKMDDAFKLFISEIQQDLRRADGQQLKAEELANAERIRREEAEQSAYEQRLAALRARREAKRHSAKPSTAATAAGQDGDSARNRNSVQDAISHNDSGDDDGEDEEDAFDWRSKRL